jgi:hypothetical protein
VHRVLYLLFNEGYHGASAESAVRAALCHEVMRLAALLLEHRLGATPANSRQLMDYITLVNVFQGCADLAPANATAPLNLAPSAPRCADPARSATAIRIMFFFLHLGKRRPGKFRPPDIAYRKMSGFGAAQGGRGGGRGGAALGRRAGEGKPNTRSRKHREAHAQVRAAEDCRRLLEHLTLELRSRPRIRRSAPTRWLEWTGRGLPIRNRLVVC